MRAFLSLTALVLITAISVSAQSGVGGGGQTNVSGGGGTSSGAQAQAKFFATFCGGLNTEGLVGDQGWYSDLGGNSGSIGRTNYAAPDANHQCNLDILSTTNTQQTGMGWGFCASGTVAAACNNFQTNELFPAPSSTVFDFTWVFKFQADTVNLVQRTQNDACTTGTSTCNVTITSTTAGNALICFVNSVSSAGGATVLSSCTDSGDTFSSCVSLGGTACIAQDATQGDSNGLMVNLSGAGGKTTLTCNLNANASATWTCGVYEFHSNGGVFSFDTSGNVVRTTAVTQAGVPLVTSTSTPNGVVVQIGVPSTSLAASNFVGQNFVGNRDALASGEAYLPYSTGGNPYWVLGSSGRFTASAVALKTASNNTTITSMTACSALLNITENNVTGALGSSCDQSGLRQGLFIRYSTNTSDTHWTYGTCGASACTTQDSGVTPVPSNWVCARVRSLTAGTLLFSIGQDATSGCSNMSSETSISTNVPTIPLSPWFSVTTFNTVWKHLIANEFFGTINNGSTAP